MPTPYLLQKFPGKAGWTYALIPDIPQDKSNPFGWVVVNGFIDDYELKNHKLMPMGNGQLFLPVKASIRKQIKKQAGDWVNIELSIVQLPEQLPQELLACLEDYPAEYQKFKQTPEHLQKQMIQYIYTAKTETQKAQRIVEILDQLLK